LKDLKRTKLPRCRMIWILPHPFSPLLSASCLSFSVFLCVAGRGNSREGEEGMGRMQIIQRRESLVFYKSFNTLFFEVTEVWHFLVRTRTWIMPVRVSVFKKNYEK